LNFLNKSQSDSTNNGLVNAPARRDVKNLKIVLESSQRCPGTCSGCMLQQVERRNGAGYDQSIKHAAACVVDKFVDDFFSRFDATEEEDSCSVQFLQGDHLQMPHEDIPEYVKWAKQITQGKMRAYFATSGIGRPDHIRKTVDLYYQAEKDFGQPITFLMVVDPAKIKASKFTEIYHENITYIRNRFPLQEPAFNVGPNIWKTVTPRDADSFMQRHGFYEADLGLFPTEDRVHEYAANWQNMMKWIREFVDLAYTEKNYTVSFPPLLASIMDETQELNFQEYVEYLANSLSEQVYIDNNGEMFSLLAGGLGNVVPLSTRFGFDTLHRANANYENFSIDYWREKTWKTAQRVASDYSRDPICSACPHQRACAASGLSIVRKVMRDQNAGDPNCPISIRPLLDFVARDFRNGSNGTSTGSPGDFGSS